MLEREIGVPLFHRLSRGVALTDAGSSLLVDARRILDDVGRAVERSRSRAAGIIGRVRVGFTISASFDALVNGSFSALRQRFPNVELLLEEPRSTELVDQLRAGTLDLAFVRPPLLLPKEQSMNVLSDEPMVAALPVGHRLAGKRRLELVDLAAETFILYPRAASRGLSTDVVDKCEEAGFTPRSVQVATQLASTINLVASSLGISIVPACMRQSRVDAVRYIDLRGHPLRAQLAIAFRRGEASAPVRNFLVLIRNDVSRVAPPTA